MIQTWKNLDWDYRHILEEQIAPVILNIEEEAKHQHHVHQGDEDDNDHAGVQRHLSITSVWHPLMINLY